MIYTCWVHYDRVARYQNLINDKMRIILTFIFLIFLINADLFCQTKTITGRIISDYLEPMPGVSIQYIDALLIVRTDLEGRFNVEIPSLTDSLLLGGVGLEPTVIQLTGDCDTLEVVMMLAGSYDFMTLRKVDRIRMKRFKALPNIHKQAFDQGLFITEYPCYKQVFEYYRDK